MFAHNAVKSVENTAERKGKVQTYGTQKEYAGNAFANERRNVRQNSRKNSVNVWPTLEGIEKVGNLCEKKI